MKIQRRIIYYLVVILAILVIYIVYPKIVYETVFLKSGKICTLNKLTGEMKPGPNRYDGPALFGLFP